jgi:O-antigen/teichoic acid export membrane protein
VASERLIMGIIQRQGIKQSVAVYAGTAIGALSTIFIYPNEPELYGLWLTLFGIAMLFVPFASFGINSITIRFFPHFRDPEGDHKGFLPFLLIAGILFFSMFTGVFLLFRKPLIEGLVALQFDVSVITSYFVPILVLTFFILLQSILTSYISNFRRIVVPAIITNLWPKVALPSLILLAWQGYLSPEEYVWGILVMQLAGVLAQLLYLRKLGELRLRPTMEVLRSGMLGEMGTYGMYGILGGLGSVFAFRIDHVMISMLLGLVSTGVYGIAQFIGNSINIPTRAIYAIAGPIIATAWENNNLGEIKLIYRKSSLNLLIIGLPLYAMVVISIDDIFRLTSQYESLKPAVAVVLLIGFGKIVDMSFSVNGQILAFSKYYRVNLVAILVLAIINLGLNYVLIPRNGIVGAAWASLIAIVSYNMFRSAFIWYKLRMQPFSWRTGVVLLIAISAGVIAWIIPDSDIPLLDIAQNSALVVLIYIPPILLLRLSEDMNRLFNNLLAKVNNFIGRND